MKKAKIFLTALTVLAVVGGALAFKAKTQLPLGFCNTANLKCDLSPTTLFNFKTTLVGDPIQRDIITKDCVFDPVIATYTCKTLITTTIE